MATISLQTITESGLTPTMTAAAGGGDQFLNSRGDVFLFVENGSGSSVTVTVTAQTTTFSDEKYGSSTKANITKAVSAAGQAMIGPFAPNAFNDSSGYVQVSYSSATSVTVAAIRFNRHGEN